jgi:serine/threonine protein kinase/tetratricopeptide (TPR) repeat protein
MIGKTISHYLISEKLGEGGMGVVYKAEDTTLRRMVALKFLPPHLIGTRRDMARFLVEARAAAALDHPNICTIFEIDEGGNQPFISMAYIEGKNLKDIVEDGPLNLADALRYALQVARGLEEAHAKGVVHRDIKSANIVVSDKGHAIVMDFGLAKLEGQTKITRTGTTMGTVSYMSPEQARGEEVDHRSDIWSLGVVLYRMLVGRYPFEGEHQTAVIYAVLNDSHEPLTALRTGIPLELERIVNKMLAKDRRERFQTVSDLIVDLKAVNTELSEKKTRTLEVKTSKPARLRRAWVMGGVAAMIVVSGLIAWWQLSDRSDTSTADHAVTVDERVSIAVLPLDNMSQNEDQEYVADGMTEALIAELAQIRALRVISRTSVMRFKRTTLPMTEVAAALGVNTIIEGSVMQVGGRVRVTAQLIDGKTDEHLWAQSYERDMSDILALQSEVARAIADEVKVELTSGESERLASSSAVDPRAYDLYMRGRYYWNRRTSPDLRRALELYQQAVEIQPDWALGYSALAETHAVMAGWGTLPTGEAYPRVREFAGRALELDPSLGSAWACLAGTAENWDWNWDRAEKNYLKAIELEPNNATSHQWYADFLSTHGRFDEATEQIDLAQKLDPLAPIIGLTKAGIYSISGELDRAIVECNLVVAMDSTFLGVYLLLGDTSRYAGRGDQAAEAYAQYYEAVAPGAGESIRRAFASGGIDAVTRVVIGGTRQASRFQYISPATMGFLFASIGEADSAMVWLDKAYNERAHPLVSAAVSLHCEPIRDDPRFIDLLKRMKLENVKPSYTRN